MITGELKNKVDKVWETFWTGGITNPLTVIEQFTYLLYLRTLDANEKKKEKDAEIIGTNYEGIFPKDKPQLRWSLFSNLGPDEMFKSVSEDAFPFIKNLAGKHTVYSKFMRDAMFLIPTPSLLSRVVAGIDGLFLSKDKDTLGDLYEYLLSKLSTAGTNGQFRTPRHIIDMIVRLMKPTPEDLIMDPAMGTAGFLVGCEEYLRKNHGDLFLIQGLKEHFNQNMFYGYEMDGTMLRIGAMNMLLHNVDNPNISYRDSLSEENKDTEKYTLILANPPFKGSLDYESVSDELLQVTKTKKTELLFLALFLRMLKKGGRCASIVPDGVLFGSSKAHKSIRKEIVDHQKLEAIISMPSGVFKPYAGVSTAVMIFTKTDAGGTDNVWFYDMKADGFSLDDKRQPVEANDISDILTRFKHLDSEKEQKRTEQSFFVPVSEIRENGYDLSINKFKEIEYEEIEYEKPVVMLEKIKKMEHEIQSGIDNIEKMLRGCN